MIKKSLTLIAIGGLALTGCGLGNSGGTESKEVTENEAAAADIGAEMAAVTDEQLKDKAITMARFFGDCDDTTQGVVDVAKAGTECEAIQILTNKFVAENEWGITVERLGGATWHSYYDGLNAALASEDKPSIAVMHGSNLPEYADKGMLVEISPELGVDLGAATEAAQDAVRFNDASYALPFDIHATISHLNMDILKEAGLLEADGTYTMPTSVEKFMADAKAVKDKTGKNYIDIAFSNDPMGSRLWMSLVWQQGEDFVDVEGRKASTTNDASKKALQFINDIVKAGYTTPTHDYDASQQAFLRGESAIMFNGVWAVDQYSREAGFEYQVTEAPQLFDEPASWANSHIWAIPVQTDADVVEYRAAFEFAKFLYEHTGDWAVATGHMPSTTAAVESDEYQKAPHRDQYTKTAEYAKMQPRVVEWPAIAATVQEHAESTWLNGVAVDDALMNMEAAVDSDLS